MNSHGFPLPGHDINMNSAGSNESISALFRFASKMLHSCEPNCEITVDPRQGILTARAKRRIKAGDLITNSYAGNTPDFMNKNFEDRRKKLNKERGFKCICTRCIREEKDHAQA